MVKRLTVIFVVCLFVLGIFAAGAFAIDSKVKIKPQKKAVLDETGIMAPRALDTYQSLGGKYVGCENIDPEIGVIKEHVSVGNTWRDYQSNSTIGRRMGVMPQNAFRHFMWSYLAAQDADRYVYANCWNPWDDFWTGPSAADGGAERGSAYPYYQEMHYDPATLARKEIPAMSYHNYIGTWGTMLAIDDGECEGGWSRNWDVPDWVAGYTSSGVWPRCKVVHAPITTNTGRDYFHIVVNEAVTLYRLGWVRCYVDASNNLVCETWHNGYKTYTNPQGALDAGPLAHPIALVDTCCFIDPVVETSPVSKKVAIVYTSAVNHDHANETYGCDLVYCESPNNGDNWLAGATFPSTRVNCTNYPAEGTEQIERAFIDLGACYDYDDVLHIAFITTYVPVPAGGSYYPQYAWVKHYDSQTQLIRTVHYYEETEDIHSQNEACISKVSISAKDPIYHPGEGTYLFCTWTQVDSADRSLAGFGNRDIFGCGSSDGGASWEGKKWNLTRTATDQCAAGECVSEGWASLAQNMYNGDLHFQYICDRDAGPSIWDEGAWTDNDVYYLDLEEWVLGATPGVGYRIDDPPEPPNWTKPPLKVPADDRVVFLKVFNIGNAPLDYSVTDDEDVCIQTPGAQPTLDAGDSSGSIPITLKGSGCLNSFVDGNVIITSNDPDNPTVYLPIQAVVGVDDYYECPRDPATFDTLDNTNGETQAGLKLYVNANCQEWFHYYDAVADTTHEVGFQGGVIVATIVDGDTLVGRSMGENDHKADAQDPLYMDQCDVDWEPPYWLLYTKDIFINDLDPPTNDKWFGWTISKQVKFFKPTAPPEYRNIVIKQVKVKWQSAPGWWPGDKSDYAAYGNTYIGMAMDLDCPWDSLGRQNGRNFAGYDDVNEIAYQQGWDQTEHPEWNNFYCGMALAQETADTTSIVAVAPFGTYNVRNDTFLYPTSPWGWKDGQLYQLAANNVPGVVQDADTLYGLDRSQVFTALEIPAGSGFKTEASFTLVEAVAPTGLAELQSLIALGRLAVARERNYKPGVWPLESGLKSSCGDVTGDGVVELADVLKLISYCYKGGPIPVPFNSGELTGDGIIELADVLKLISYCYKGGSTPVCPTGCPWMWL